MGNPTDRVKLIAIDMDGTLLSTQKTISEENKQAIRHWSKLGVPIVLASGRMDTALNAIADELEVDCILMGFNGAKCISTNEQKRKVLFHSPLPDGMLAQAVDFVQNNNHFLNVYLDGKLFGEADSNKRHYPDGYAYLNQASYEFIESYDSIKNSNPTKILIIKDDPAEIDTVYDAVQQTPLAKALNMIKTDSHNSSKHQYYLEFLHPDVNKATGLKALCEILNIDKKHIVAFGDGSNDVEMLAYAGIGICMAQGSKEAKSAASSHVSKWSNDESAVAKELMLLAQSD